MTGNDQVSLIIGNNPAVDPDATAIDLSNDASIIKFGLLITAVPLTSEGGLVSDGRLERHKTWLCRWVVIGYFANYGNSDALRGTRGLGSDHGSNARNQQIAQTVITGLGLVAAFCCPGIQILPESLLRKRSK